MANNNTIYLVGVQRMKLADMQALASAISAEHIHDWRPKKDGRLNPPTLERAFPGKYKDVAAKVFDATGNITAATLDRLTKLPGVKLLMFHREDPEKCGRHANLAMPLECRGTAVVHVMGDELVRATDLQNAIDTDTTDIPGTAWRTAPVAPAPVNMPTSPLAPINAINDLSDRAMLVRLSLHMPGFQRQNKKVAKEVADKYGADETMGKFVESLIAKEAMARLNQIESGLRANYYELTLPWDDNGTRICSAAGYMHLVALVRAGQSQWEPAVDAFVADWEAHVGEAKRKRNGLFDPSQYPTKEQVRHRFEFIWRVSPLPKTEDFRVGLSSDEQRVIREQYEDTLKQTLNESMADVWNRLKTVVTQMRDRLKDLQEGESKTVRDSVVTNITELLGVVPALNLTGNPDVTRFCADIQRELTTVEPETLREDPKVREDVIARADEILGKMAAYL